MSQIFFNTGKSALREPGIVFHPHLQSVARIFLPGSEIDPQLNNTEGIYFLYAGGSTDESNYPELNYAGEPVPLWRDINFQ